jgi:hypothetical protein
MKHALVDQLLIGLLVLGGIFVFVATVNDDTMARNKVYELKKLTSNSARAMAKHYMEQEDICQAQNISNSILSQSNLGAQLLSGNHISYVWRDSDSDGFPNSITVTISGYKEKTFWYKFLQLDEFVINPISATADVDVDNATYDVTMRYGGSNAGYFNMIGTYELDEDGCIQNPNILLADKRAHNVGDELGSIKMPQSRVFIIANGYSLYGNKTASINSDISIQGCNPPTAEVPNAYPNVTIDGLRNKAPTYFQNTEFNSDNGYAHMQIIPKSVHDTYVAYVNGHIDGHDHTYEQWVAYAQANNIEYQEDPNYEYIFAMEDLPNGGDKDFNDILLDTTMIAVPKELDPNVVVNDGIITATCLQEEIEEPILNKSVKDHCNSIANGCSRCLRKNERCDEWSAYVQAQCGSDLACYDCMYSQEGCTQSIYDQFFGS